MTYLVSKMFSHIYIFYSQPRPVQPPSTPPLPIQRHHSLLPKSPSFFSVVLLILMTLQTTLQLVTCHYVVLPLATAEPVGMKLQGLQLGKLLRSLHVDRPVMIPRFPYGMTKVTQTPVLLAMTMRVVFRVLSLIHLMELLTMPWFSKFVCTPPA